MNIWNLKEVIFGETRNITKEAHDASLLLYTDIEVSWEPVYKGRKVIQVTFQIEQRDSWGRFITGNKAAKEFDGQMTIYDFLKGDQEQ